MNLCITDSLLKLNARVLKTNPWLVIYFTERVGGWVTTSEISYRLNLFETFLPECVTTL
jgi:hypothetical protein